MDVFEQNAAVGLVLLVADQVDQIAAIAYHVGRLERVLAGAVFELGLKFGIVDEDLRGMKE